MTGNLSHQIEHHLFPDPPSNRYPDIASRVRELCQRYGLPYNTGTLTSQTTKVWKRILRLALPGGGTPPGHHRRGQSGCGGAALRGLIHVTRPTPLPCESGCGVGCSYAGYRVVSECVAAWQPRDSAGPPAR